MRVGATSPYMGLPARARGALPAAAYGYYGYRLSCAALRELNSCLGAPPAREARDAT